MKYLFILGNHPGLSVAEISCKLSPKNYFFLDKQVLQVETKEEFDAEDLISRLGGTVKIAELLQENCADLNEEIKKYLPENWEGKFRFGFSSYGFKRGEIKDIAIKVKKELKNRSISSRWTTSRERNLSSVAVKENKLLEKGKEFIVLRKEGIQLLAETKAVQNFKELSRRDYGRPARDSRSGMIPPKLAQIMINIASGGNKEQTLLDPFCGSGTVLMEAYLMGFERIIGTDNSGKAIEDSRENTEWLENNFDLSGEKEREIELMRSEASSLSDHLKKNSVDIIVTEPYLGPQKKLDDIKKIKKELEKLYSGALAEFEEILKPGGRVVMIWPVLKKRKPSFIHPELKNLKIVSPVKNGLDIDQTFRNTLVYSRKGQRVMREVVVLELMEDQDQNKTNK